MSTNEAPQFGDNFPEIDFKDLILPGEIDQDWCDEFTAEHTGGDFSAVIEADCVLASRDIPGPEHTGPQRLFFYGIETDKGGSALLQGRIVDARMVPEYDRDERGRSIYQGHAAYLTLTGTVQTYPLGSSYTYEWARSRYDRVYVPLSEGGSLLIVPSSCLEQPEWFD